MADDGRPHGARTRRAVLFLHTATRPPLGADTWVQAQIVDALDRSRFEPIVACNVGTPDGPTPTYEAMRRIDGVRIVPANLGVEYRGGRLARVADIGRAATSVARLALSIRRHRVALIHTTDRPRDASVAVLLGRLTGARSIVHAHSGFDARWMNRSLRWAIRNADAVVGVSAYVRETLVDAGVDSSRAHAVLNGIDVAAWRRDGDRDAVRRELGIGADDVVIITVCRLLPSKGPSDLVRAVAALVPTVPHVRAIIAGKEMVPGYLAELQALAAELGVTDRVHFVGHRSDVPQLMAASDVYAMASIGEPFGLVFAEAMAVELPVVALRSGGAPEVVEHGVTGLLSEVGDAPSFVGNLQVLAGDPELRRRMGAAGRRRVEERFDVSRMAADVEDVYELVLSHADEDRRAGRRRRGTRGRRRDGSG